MTGRAWHGMPGWLPFEVRRHYTIAVSDGREQADGDAVNAITDKVLREAPEFARLLVARQVQSMFRADLAARKRRRPETDRQKRKARERKQLAEDCAALSADGWTLREIATEKGVSHQTVANLIAEWLMSTEAAVSRQRELSKDSADLTGDFDNPNVIPLVRRSA